MNEFKPPGQLMATELAEAQKVFCASAMQTVPAHRPALPEAIYTIARGSSDAAANVLSYEFMNTLGLPVTSLAPSVFSLGKGVELRRAMALLISQSGASDDLVHSARRARLRGAQVIALTNQPGSAVEAEADLTLPINAGPERAVPATKSVIGSIGAGLALLSSYSPEYRAQLAPSIQAFQGADLNHPLEKQITAAFLRARNIYVIGRDTGFGAAHEVALKLKECCALHAEAFSSSEVLHGPLQLATNPLLVLMLDTEKPEIQSSLDQAQARFEQVPSTVIRIRPSDVGLVGMTPATAAAALLSLLYPIILNTALALGLDPDAPTTLAKVTSTT